MLYLQAQIYVRVFMNDFIIPLDSLSAGNTKYSWQVGKAFFDSFENSEILDAALSAEVSVEKSGKYLGIDCLVKGQVTVLCDRCLEELQLPVEENILLSVKYGEDDAADQMEGEREIYWIPRDSAELDMSQVIYDYVCLSLPMQRHHADGECNPETVKYLGNPEVEELKNDEKMEADNPFAALKGLFD